MTAPPSSGRFARLRRWWPRLLAGIVVAGVALSYVPDFWRMRRTENAHETILYYFAQNLGEASLCEGISWAAHRRYSLLFGGGGASYWRSDCYEQVAEIRHDPSVCWHVRPLVDLDPLSTGYSALACRRRARAGYRSAIALPDEVLVHTFVRLGYDIDAMGRAPGTPLAIHWQDVYRHLEHEPAVLARTQALLAQATPAQAPGDLSYLAHLAAIGTANPEWCAYVPAGQTIGQVAAPFRDWCYYTVAFDANDTAICERMTPAAREATVLAAIARGVRPPIAEQMGLHAECRRSGQHVGPRLHYGPELPDDERTAQRLFAVLGVARPAAHDWPMAVQANFYRDFVFSLWPKRQPDAARDAARATLVTRILALATDR